MLFLALFGAFYYFNIGFFAVTNPGKNYIPFLAEHVNYIRGLRVSCWRPVRFVLRCLGYDTVTNEYQLLTAGKGVIRMVYSCLGLGVMSFFAAFVIAYPKRLKNKLWFGIVGLVIIQLLNITRFVLLALFWNKGSAHAIDHHTIFNIVMYIIIGVTLYFWITANSKRIYAKN